MLNKNTLISKVIEYNKLNENQIEQLKNPIDLKVSEHHLFIQAEKIILDAIALNKKIIVCGDYDADGICSTSILYYVLKKLNAHVGYYIPNRFSEGYGLNDNTVDLALKKGYALFILVDNGVSATSSLKKIKEANAQSLILDHHSYEGEVVGDCLVHPNLLDDHYKNMCGSGLAYNLAERLIGYDAFLVSLAGIATIADLMPLWGFNRSLVIRGLKEINAQQRHVFMNLLNSRENITETDIAFQLVPKLNAIGRLADKINVNKVVEYLCSEDNQSIDIFAKEIIRINDLRKDINQKMYIRALELITDEPVQVLYDPMFHEGIVGITAGRLANELKRPVFVFNHEGSRLKGSARSYGAINLKELVEPASDLLNRFGGHAQAAGLELDIRNIDEFKQRMVDNSEVLNKHEVNSNDIEMLEEWFNIESFNELNKYRPFGQGFEIPSFRFNPISIISNRIIRGGISFDLSFFNRNISAVYFQSTLDERLIRSNFTSIIGRVSIDNFRNQTKLKILIESFA